LTAFQDILSRPLAVMDGAMGTRLMDCGLEPGACGDAWNLRRPGDVLSVHGDYVRAGADCILTNTFGANPVALGRHGLAEDTEVINAAGVELACRAARGGALVFGDVGPTGKILEPFGDLPPGQARDAFRRQVAALAGAGPDALIFETFQSAGELRLVLEAAREVCDLPLIPCLTFSLQASGGYRSLMGEGPEALAGLAAEFDCEVWGTNCGQGIETMPGLIRELSGLRPGTFIVAKPNAGLPELVDGRTVYRQDAAVFATFVPGLVEAGARMVGGCDGTDAGHVRAIRRFADSL
jgi:5-methyltetrahydrofolate--homocysteine methyltransferase